MCPQKPMQFTHYMFADIQEFYESTLLDENKTSQEKTLETLRIASKWEREQPFTHNHSKAEVGSYHVC